MGLTHTVAPTLAVENYPRGTVLQRVRCAGDTQGNALASSLAARFCLLEPHIVRQFAMSGYRESL